MELERDRRVAGAPVGGWEPFLPQDELVLESCFLLDVPPPAVPPRPLELEGLSAERVPAGAFREPPKPRPLGAPGQVIPVQDHTSGADPWCELPVQPAELGTAAPAEPVRAPRRI